MFKSAESALIWAGEVRATQLVKLPSTNRMCWKPGRGTDNDVLIGLSDEERHRQADNIYSVAIALADPVSAAYLCAKYFDDTDNVSRIVSRVHMSLSERSIDYTILILSYIGAKIGSREITCKMIRDALCCGGGRVGQYRKMIFDIMDKIHYRAIDEVRTKLVSARLVEDRAGAVNY